jgi:transcriptional regulator with XRE-family HTH domain
MAEKMMATGRSCDQLRRLRIRLGLTARDVAELSQKVAELENNPEFYISNGWLAEVENSNSVPSVYKLYSLSSIDALASRFTAS